MHTSMKQSVQARQPESPNSRVKAASRETRLTLGQKVDLLCALCQLQKPEHRRIEHTIHPQTGEPLTFFPGKVLSFLIDYVAPNKKTGFVKELDEEHLAKLESLHWFYEWKQGLISARDIGPEGAEPELDEKIEMLCRTYTEPRGFGHLCTWGAFLAPRKAVRRNGKTCELHGSRLMERLSSHFFRNVPGAKRATKVVHISEKQSTAIQELPWFSKWLAEGIKRRRTAYYRTVVTKEQKLKLLYENYGHDANGVPRLKPNWTDQLPVESTAVLDEKGNVGDVWVFKPATFIDDLVDNWLLHGKPGVVLSEQQKEEFEEKLPWAAAWLESVLDNRAKKRQRASPGAPRSVPESPVRVDEL